MSRRRLNDWISGYLEYSEDTEPPLSYHNWVAISAIASTLRRKTFLKWGLDTIYPNMYIVLIGPSGKCRKGTAMRIGYSVLKEMGIKIASESIIREALIRNMKNAVENFIDPQTKQIHFHSSLTVLSEELSVFLGQNNVKFLADLTDWYDCKDEWTYETKNSGVDTIQGVCLNLLGATAADWLVSILPQEAIGGGFTSRVIFIVEENKRKIVAKPKRNERQDLLFKALKEDLERIGTLSGQFVFSPDAEDMYISWYEEQEAAVKKGNMAITDPRFAGYCDRRATHVRKLSMIFAASRGADMMIMPDDFTRAFTVLKAAEVRMPKVFGGLGSARYSQITEKILSYLASHKKVSRSELLATFYRDVDLETLQIIENTLAAMKVIKVVIDVTGKETIYQYIGMKQ